MNELLPCPFCGGTAQMNEITVTDWRLVGAPIIQNYFVNCKDGNCMGGLIDLKAIAFSTEHEAITAWNKRAERTCKPLGTIRYDYEGGYAGFEYETELSCGHNWRDTFGDFPDYCPKCGAKVVDNG